MYFKILIPMAVVVTALATIAEAGAIPGPKVTSDSVNAYTTDVYHIAFDTDLDLFVYDEAGDLVASDTDYTDDCLAAWTPYCTQVFTIKVENLGCVYNRYGLATN